jgi:hypothetical protein
MFFQSSDDYDPLCICLRLAPGRYSKRLHTTDFVKQNVKQAFRGGGLMTICYPPSNSFQRSFLSA